MKKFLKQSVVFSVLTILVLTLLIVGTTLFTKKSFDYSISKNKNILIVGDSRTESAINDSILNNAYNFSQAGSCYFYSYLKAREFVNHNPQIDTLIVSYSYNSLKKEMDEWLIGPEKLKFKIRDHLFLFNSKDYKALLLASPKNVLTFTPQVIAHNFKVWRNGKSAIGGFDKLRRDKLQDDIQRLQNENTEDDMLEYSKYQEEYLLKIYTFCKEKNIKLILINAPIHQAALKNISDYKAHFCTFYASNMADATLIDHASFNMPDSGFADAFHLDYKGAKIYTEYLMQTGFAEDSPYCNSIK